jgi:hypothetical protein
MPRLGGLSRFLPLGVGKSALAGDFWVYVGNRSLESLWTLGWMAA